MYLYKYTSLYDTLTGSPDVIKTEKINYCFDQYVTVVDFWFRMQYIAIHTPTGKQMSRGICLQLKVQIQCSRIPYAVESIFGEIILKVREEWSNNYLEMKKYVLGPIYNEWFLKVFYRQCSLSKTSKLE